MTACGKETHDDKGAVHRCGLPVESRDPTLVHIHVCGLPYMALPLDRPGTCRHQWRDV